MYIAFMPSASPPCDPQALSLASDDAMADVWYNVGQVAIGIGDLGLSYQARRRLGPHFHAPHSLGAGILHMARSSAGV